MSLVGDLKRRVGAIGAGTRRAAPQAFAAGEFYSPVVNVAEVLATPDVGRIWPPEPPDPVGIDVRAEHQLALLGELARYRLPSEPPVVGPAYDPGNEQFPPQDAALLYAMVRHLQPRRMVEVGCGWSTTVTAQAIRDGGLETRLTGIDPHPRAFLHALGDLLTLRQEKVEHTPIDVFDALAAGDILFIDSSHVVKTGSDVVHQLLEVVPRLADGVVVHVHDIFLPEDYPVGWVRSGFNWNEQYLLRAFLIGNARAHVIAMNRWLALRHPSAVTDAFGEVPFTGSSLWFVTGPDPAA